MSSDGKVLEEGREEPSHETPQAITITIMDPSALETTTLDPTLVTSMQAQDTDQGMSTLLVMPREGHRTKDILQTVTETHMGTQELPVISSISNTEEESQQSTIQVMSKSQDDVEGEGMLAGVGEAADEEEGDEGDDLGDPLSQHCLICNLEMATTESEKPIPVFKSQTSTTHRKMAVFLGTLVGQKLTSRKAHSDIICRRCFNLLDKVDALEVEIRDTKEEIITKFQETVTAYGGRARRRKPATAKKSDYVFPKVEPEEDILGLEMDKNFEPRMEDLLEEEQDHREDRTIQDEEWEPEFKRPKIKKEPVEPDPNGPPKRKRGRPRKDASKPKELDEGDHPAETPGNSNEAGEEGRLCRPGAMKTKSCIYCDEEVPIVQLMSHLEGHEQQQYPCPYCSLKAPRLSLSRHIQQQHQELIMTCEICCAKFLESDLYRKHLETHCVGLHHCSDCGKIFGTEDELHNHANVAHIPKSEDNYSCSLCSKTYTSRFKYISHALKFHKGGIPIEGVVWGGRGLLACNICEKRFKKASLFISHEKTHRTRKFHCHYCLNKYPSELFLHDHLLTHQFGEYDCSDCLVKFASRNQLNIHKEKMHNHKVNRVCEYCNREFKEYIQLISHKRKAHPESEESQKAKYTCGDCGRKFMVKGNFLRHMKLHEKGKSEKKCACNICGKVMSNKYALASHLNTHTRESSLKCKSCDKTFVTKYTLLDHVRRIHDELGSGRDKICKQCGRSFFTNAELKYHLKTHTGERPYRCEMCGETYLSSSTLRYHMQKHSNVMFVCQDCQAKFKNYVGWSAHMKRVHGVTCVKDYTREHGILQAVLENESPLYIVAQGHAKTVDATQNISSKESLEKECLNSATLAVGLEETVVSLPGKEVGNIIHVVSYDDLANPLVHTVDAAEVGLVKPEPEETCITQPSSNLPSSIAAGNTSIDPGSDGNYPQNSERTRVMIPDGWEVILPTESEESQVVMTGGWEDARITVPQTSEESQMVLTNEWEETQGMAQLVISEEGDETRVVMTSWKDCVDY